MSYVAEGIDQRPEVLQTSATDSLVYYPKADGAPAGVITAAFVTIRDPSGAEKVARTAAVIAGAKLSRSQAWPEGVYALDENYQAIWEWTVGGVTFTDRQYFDVVLNKLPCKVDTSDLEEIYPNILAHLQAIEQPDASRFIRRAWSELLDRIRSAGYRPSLIIDAVRLVNPAVHLSLHYTCNALAREATDIWTVRAKDHRKIFDSLFNGLGKLEYDHDEDGEAEGVAARTGIRRWGV